MSVHSVDLEMQSPTHPLPTATSGDEEEEDRQCWRDVEAETGYRSYTSFLEALPETGPQYRSLPEHLASTTSFGEVHVLNILEDGGLSISMKMQGLSEDRALDRSLVLDEDRKKCTQLLRSLRSPPENTPSRIVVWSIRRGFFFFSGLVDAIGLGLKIRPDFFATLLTMVREGFNENPCTYLGLDYVIIGNSIATVARNYIPNERVPPVLFVVKVHHRETDFLRLSRSLDKDYDGIVKEVLTSEIYGTITHLHPAHRASDMRSLEDLAASSLEDLHRPSNHVYLNLVSKYVQHGAAIDAQGDDLLLNAILPLLHLQVLYLHALCRITQRELLNLYREASDKRQKFFYPQRMFYQHLDAGRFELRRMLEGLEEGKICFVKFARLQKPAKWLEGQPWINQEEEITEAISGARVVEAEARDYMQLQIGNLSIEESRKSIQLSSQQMSEAKRVKIFTVLAFIYVPINLATSVFGMNLQQLNQNGQNFWSFVVTAIVAMLVTGLMWSSLELYNVVREHKYRMKWFRTQPEEQIIFRAQQEEISIGVRVAILLGFID